MLAASVDGEKRVSDVPVSPRLCKAVEELTTALWEMDPRGDYSYAINLRGELVAASNMYYGVVLPRRR